MFAAVKRPARTTHHRHDFFTARDAKGARPPPGRPGLWRGRCRSRSAAAPASTRARVRPVAAAGSHKAGGGGAHPAVAAILPRAVGGAARGDHVLQAGALAGLGGLQAAGAVARVGLGLRGAGGSIVRVISRALRRSESPRGAELRHLQLGRSVPPGRPVLVGVKIINVSPSSPPPKLKPAAATPLDSPDRAESKRAVGRLAPAGTGYELAVTSYTLVRARVPRGFRARGIFFKKPLSKVVTDSDPYPTNIPYK